MFEPGIILGIFSDLGFQLKRVGPAPSKKTNTQRVSSTGKGIEYCRLVGMECFWLKSPVEGCACRFPAFTGWLVCRFCEWYNSPVKDCAWVFPAFTGWFWRVWRGWTSPPPGSFDPHNCLRRWRSKVHSVGCLFVCRAERKAWLRALLLICTGVYVMRNNMGVSGEMAAGEKIKNVGAEGKYERGNGIMWKLNYELGKMSENCIFICYFYERREKTLISKWLKCTIYTPDFVSSKFL